MGFFSNSKVGIVWFIPSHASPHFLLLLYLKIDFTGGRIDRAVCLKPELFKYSDYTLAWFHSPQRLWHAVIRWDLDWIVHSYNRSSGCLTAVCKNRTLNGTNDNDDVRVKMPPFLPQCGKVSPVTVLLWRGRTENSLEIPHLFHLSKLSALFFPRLRQVFVEKCIII